MVGVFCPGVLRRSLSGRGGVMVTLSCAAPRVLGDGCGNLSTFIVLMRGDGENPSVRYDDDYASQEAPRRFANDREASRRLAKRPPNEISVKLLAPC